MAVYSNYSKFLLSDVFTNTMYDYQYEENLRLIYVATPGTRDAY